MELKLLGKPCVEALSHLYEKIEKQEYTLPIDGLLRLESEVLHALIPLGLVTNIERVGTSEDIPMVALTLLVQSDAPWRVRFGKDAKGKHVFTNPSLDE